MVLVGIKGPKGQGFFSKKIFSNFFSKNDVFRGNFKRGIRKTHFRSLKTLPSPLFRELRCVLKRKLLKIRFLLRIKCGCVRLTP